MKEEHHSCYNIQPSSIKMYRDIKEIYSLHGIKKDVTQFVAKYPNYQQVNVEP